MSLIEIESHYPTTGVLPRCVFTKDKRQAELNALIQRLAIELNKVKRVRPTLKVKLYPFLGLSEIYCVIQNEEEARIGELVESSNKNFKHSALYFSHPHKDINIVE